MSGWNYDRGYDRGYTSRSPYRGSGDDVYRGTGTGPDRAYAADYVYGSAAPAVDPYDEDFYREERRRRIEQQHRAQRLRRSVMTPAMIVFLAGALIITAACLFQYITLNAQVTSAVEEIADLESELSELRSDNDEALNAIESGISLDDIKYRAIAELGMTYASEDQIIHYSNEESDYVRQVIQP